MFFKKKNVFLINFTFWFMQAPSDSSKKGIADSPIASVMGDYVSDQHNANSLKVKTKQKYFKLLYNILWNAITLTIYVFYLNLK